MSALDLDQKEKFKNPDEDQGFSLAYDLPSKPPSFSRVKAHIIKALRAKRYKELASDLRSQRLSEEQMKQFFAKEGYSILYWCVNNASDAKSLACLCDLMDKMNAQKIFQELFFAKNLEILQDFLFTGLGLEMMGRDDEENRLSQFSKFQCLLKIGGDRVKEFIAEKTRSHCRYLTEKIRANFKAAEIEFDKNNQQNKNALTSGNLSEPVALKPF